MALGAKAAALREQQASLLRQHMNLLLYAQALEAASAYSVPGLAPPLDQQSPDQSCADQPGCDQSCPLTRTPRACVRLATSNKSANAANGRRSPLSGLHAMADASNGFSCGSTKDTQPGLAALAGAFMLQQEIGGGKARNSDPGSRRSGGGMNSTQNDVDCAPHAEAANVHQHGCMPQSSIASQLALCWGSGGGTCSHGGAARGRSSLGMLPLPPSPPYGGDASLLLAAVQHNHVPDRCSRQGDNYHTQRAIRSADAHMREISHAIDAKCCDLVPSSISSCMHPAAVGRSALAREFDQDEAGALVGAALQTRLHSPQSGDGPPSGSSTPSKLTCHTTAAMHGPVPPVQLLLPPSLLLASMPTATAAAGWRPDWQSTIEAAERQLQALGTLKL